MTSLRYLAGVAAVVAYGGGAAFVAAAARRAWFPGIDRVLRVVVGGPLLLAALLAPALLTGSLGVLEPVPLLVAMAALVLVARWRLPAPADAAVAPDDDADDGDAETPAGRGARPVVVVACAVTAIRWLAEVSESASRGFRQTDDLHYHLTHAAHFARSGATWPITFDSVGDAAAFHPANASLLHATAMVLFGRDVLTLAVNLPFVVLALAAGWQIGRRVGNPAAATTLVAATLCLRSIAPGGGSALDDVVALSLLLCAVALLLEAPRAARATPAVVVAGLAAGLAAGTKLTVLVPVVALVGVVGVRRADDRRAALRYVGAAVAGGGYWYLRNLARVGNPVPVLSPGPIPGPELALQRAIEAPVLDHVLDGEVWRTYLAPGLERTFGPLWPLLLLATAVGAIAAVAGHRRPGARPWPAIAAVGIVSLASYAVTPTSGAGPAGRPVLFAANLRYALPGLLLCWFAALALPAVRRRPTAAIAAAAVVLLGTNGHEVPAVHAAVAVALLAGLAVVALAVRRLDRRVVLGLTAAAAVPGLLAGFVVQREVLDRRWRDELPRWSLYEAARGIDGAVVAVTGYPQAYPFFGEALGNEVVVLGDRATGDELRPLVGCDAFWAAVADAGAGYVVVLGDRSMVGTDLGRLLVDEPTAYLDGAAATVLHRSADGALYDVSAATPACG